MITLDEVWATFNYDPVAGRLTNRHARHYSTAPGDDAGWVRPDGYRIVGLRGRHYMAHRLIWLFWYGYWPEAVDHINGDKADNRLENLREVNNKQNSENRAQSRNNRSGHRGVSWDSEQRKWLAVVYHHNKSHKAGRFTKLEDAVTAVRAKRDELFTHHKTEHAAP